MMDLLPVDRALGRANLRGTMSDGESVSLEEPNVIGSEKGKIKSVEASGYIPTELRLDKTADPANQRQIFSDGQWRHL